MKVGDAAIEVEAKVVTQRAAAETRDAQAQTANAKANAAPQQQEKAPPTPHKIESVTKQIDSFLRSQNHQLQFRVDQGSGKMVVTVTDGETGEVIRQVPGEEAIKMAQRIEDMTGLLDEKA
ncbi:MAG TPA: flagellar protein FlaG [Steroidobacteraceae bacterium]|nr:flagellar protein FlaG [Steroidobacteraceae bacterium]